MDYEYKTRNSSLYLLLILIVCFFTFFLNNQVIPADIMEARNLATAQEMVSEGNYLVPTMNGELRLEKPPLPTWVAAVIEIITPDNIVAQRAMTGIMGTIMVVFLFLFTKKLTRNSTIGLFAALILATSYNVVMMGRTATWDIYCHSFMLGAIYFFYDAIEREGRQWGRFMFAGIFMGLSFLGKGPVSFYALLLPFLLSFFLVIRPRIKDKALPIVMMIVCFLVIAFWWPVYIFLFHHDLAVAILHKESSSWINHNVRPWYYYWQFPAEAGIWALFWLTALISFFVVKRNRENRIPYFFSIVWTLSTLLLLSFIPEKKTRYLLPILIPGSLNIAFYFYHILKNKIGSGEKTLFKINSFIIALILIAIPAALWFLFVKDHIISVFWFILISLISLAIATYILWSIFNRHGLRVKSVFAGIVLTMVMVTGLCLIPISSLFINEDRHSIKLTRELKELKELPFYHNVEEPLRIEFVYEANRIIRPIDLKSDSVTMAAPFVIVSGQPLDSLLRDQPFTIQYIDTYDNNWNKTDHKRHNPDLVRHVGIVRPTSY